MKIVQFIPLVAGILLSGQALAGEPLASQPQTQPGDATMLVPAASESAQPTQTLPVRLSADEMDRVTAGVGRDNVANEPWPALLDAGFTLNHNSNADQGVIDHAGFQGVAVPSTVPNSFCVAFC